MKKRLIVGLLISLLIVSVVLMSGCGTRKVIYNGNGHTGGSVPVDTTAYRAGQTVTVLDNTGGLVKSGQVFEGWNTQPDGGGTTYTAGQTFAMGTSDVILYAKWAYRVAYIYNSSDAGDVTAAAAFETLLDPVYPMDQIAVSSIVSTDFTQYALIVIGHNALSFSTDQTNAIQNSGLPVIGINRGGLSYFGKIGLNMKSENVASGSYTGLVVANEALSIWNSPNDLNVSSEQTVTIFNTTSQANVLYIGYLPASVLTIAYHVSQYPTSYATIAKEGSNLYWAFNGDASSFNETGNKLFLNAINYMING